MAVEDKLKTIQKIYLEKINSASSLKEIDEVFLKLFGKTGEITLLPKDFFKLSKDELKTVGPLFNKIKQELEKAVEAKREEIRENSYKALEGEQLELDSGGALLPRMTRGKGHLHPLTAFENETAKIFEKLGFSQFDGPQIDTDYNNFEVLNIPPEHPARDLWDTLYIDPYNLSYSKITQQSSANLGPQPQKLLLRTHTSSSQTQIMKDFKLPIRKMLIGRCFRYENLDPRHEHTFEQFELVYVDKKLNMGNLQYLSEHYFKEIFGTDIRARMKPKYYPFVEPGAGVDGLCIFCKGKGCKVCGGLGWLELAGAGMIHPTVLKNGGIDPEKYTGIAWGMGIMRMAMIKWGIEDVRLFNSGDLKFLEKF